MRVAVLMPALNEGPTLTTTLGRIAAQANPDLAITVYLVDDGSQPAITVASPQKDCFRVVAARHRINLGQGAAIETARQLSLKTAGYDAYVTMDSDGQHDPADLPRFAGALQAGADVVFGSRFLGIDSRTMPAGRRLLLQAARRFERMLTGLALTDAHNGYRAFSERAIRSIVLRQDRMAHATEIKLRVAGQKDLVVREIPIEVQYTDESLKKGQSSLGAFAILRDLMHDYLFGGR